MKWTIEGEDSWSINWSCYEWLTDFACILLNENDALATYDHEYTLTII